MVGGSDGHYNQRMPEQYAIQIVSIEVSPPDVSIQRGEVT